MNDLFISIQNKLNEITAIKYVDEDWGQLNYTPNPPAKFPCALIDVTALNFSNIGKDITANPTNRQAAEGTITFIIADVKLSNTSQRAPQSHKNNAWSIWTILEEVHQKVHGWKPTADSGALIRTSHKRIRRDDGIQEYQVTYSLSKANV